MAVLSDQGAHCSVAECNQVDFLPFTCRQCSRVFCLSHYRYADHSCPNAAGLDNRAMVCPLCSKGIRINQGEDPNATWERHIMSGDCSNPAGEGVRKRPRCPVPGCKEKLTETTSIVCAACGSRTCMKHRYEDAHPCGRARAFGTAPARARLGAGEWQCPRCTLVNARGASECLACGAPPSSGAARQAPLRPATPPASSAVWACRTCTLENRAAAASCAACGTARGGAPAAPSAPQWRWRCAACTLENAPGTARCAACGADAGSVAVRVEAAEASRGCGVS